MNLIVEDLGLIEYETAWKLQDEYAREIAEGIRPPTLLLLEHPHVYTFGRRGKQENLLWGESQLKEKGIATHWVDRGGDVTYHGPGQLVGYPIVRLEASRRDIRRYVRDLEEVLIRALADFGIFAGRHPEHRGVWVKNRKIASLGIRISRWVTSHGFALNVATDLSYFSLMNPCGISGCTMTSLEAELLAPVAMASVRERVSTRFGDVFERDMRDEVIARVH